MSRIFEPAIVHGNWDLIQRLEEALVEAREGRLVGVIICGITGEACGWTGAYNEGVTFPWPRLLASLEIARHEMLVDGVVDWA